MADEVKNIIETAERMKPSDTFCFSCGKDLSCFNKCCADINIVLTPYDIIRLKNKLGITSGEFLEKYTVVPFNKEQRIPVVILKLGEDEKKACQFIGESGCTVYAHRPWACRMYPVGLAASDGDKPEEFYFLMKEDVCLGLKEKKEISIESWIKEQGISEYDKMGELFRQITMHPFLLSGKDLEPNQMEMFFMACYDIDKFRRFVFESSFLKSFEVGDKTLKKIEKDDVELLKFGYQWLRFSLFKEKTMTIRSSILKSKKKELKHAAAK